MTNHEAMMQMLTFGLFIVGFISAIAGIISAVAVLKNK
jgi:hypothetical protein